MMRGQDSAQEHAEHRTAKDGGEHNGGSAERVHRGPARVSPMWLAVARPHIWLHSAGKDDCRQKA
jgi:hypothetical protein